MSDKLYYFGDSILNFLAVRLSGAMGQTKTSIVTSVCRLLQSKDANQDGSFES